MNYRILVVDDLDFMRDASRMTLERWGYRVDTATSGDEAIELVKQTDREYGLILLDYKMPKKTGAQTAREIRQINEEALIVIYSDDQTREAVLKSWDAGAIGFFEKGGDTNELKDFIENSCRKFEETCRTLKCNSELSANEKIISSLGMVGASDELADVAISVQKIKDKKDSVLILGETGTGKELIARAVHNGNGEFIPINCAAFQNPSLLEAELFGYEKGSFTGANANGKVGLLEMARGGTVFFDEIHRLSLEAQGKLLRVLQEKKIRRVGGTQEYQVTFRAIAAGKAELKEMVKKNEFLPDLYYRLEVHTIEIPALRERKDDIAPLVAFFTEKFKKETGEKKKFLMSTARYLENYSWPGNVRELENTVKKILTQSNQKTIDPKQLDSKFFTKPSLVQHISLVALDRKHEQEKREFILTALQKARWKTVRAAEMIGIPYTTLYDLMGKLKIEKPNHEVTEKVAN